MTRGGQTPPHSILIPCTLLNVGNYWHIGKWVHLSIDLTSIRAKGRLWTLSEEGWNNQRVEVIGVHMINSRLHSNRWKANFWHVQWIQAEGRLIIVWHGFKRPASALSRRWVGTKSKDSQLMTWERREHFWWYGDPKPSLDQHHMHHIVFHAFQCTHACLSSRRLTYPPRNNLQKNNNEQTLQTKTNTIKYCTRSTYWFWECVLPWHLVFMLVFGHLPIKLWMPIFPSSKLSIP